MLQSSTLPRLVALLGLFLLTACAGPQPNGGARELLSAPLAAPAPGEILTRLILLGDAGDPRLVPGPGGPVADEPVLRLARHWAAELPARTTVVFLGDNIYNDGMPAAGPRADSARVRLGAQLEVVAGSGARGVFIPGNHDWYFGREGILRQQALVTARLGPGAFLPADGSAGPAVVPLPGVRLLVLDTQRWLDRDRGRCARPPAELQAALDSLGSLLAREEPGHTVLLAHHPLDTYGGHRGMNPFRRLGSGLVGATQDLGTPAYTCLRRQLQQALRGPGRPLAVASGHEHSLQVLAGGVAAEYILVSGAGSERRVRPVGRGPATLHAAASPGFMVLDFLTDERVVLRTVVADGAAGGRVGFALQLR
jgi:hypothetical protein